MRKSKLVQLFYSLTTPQQRSLGKWLKSPYVNHRSDVILLYEYLYKTDIEHPKALQKEVVHGYVFPKEAFDADKLDYTMSFLTKYLEQFLVQELRQADPLAYTLDLARSYRHLNQNKFFRQTMRRAKQQHEKLPHRDQEFLNKSYAIEFEEYAFSVTQKRSTPRNLQMLNDILEERFIAEKLKQSCLLLAHQDVYKTQYNMGILDAVVGYVEQKITLLEQPTIALYFYYYKAATTPNQNEYFNLYKETLINNTLLFPIPEMYDLYMFAINYCIREFNQGKFEFLNETFELYKNALEYGILTNEGYLSHFAFKNISDIALRLEEIAWTENFVRKYSRLLNHDAAESYINYVWAKIHLSKKQYKKAMVALQQVEYGDLFLALAAKTALLKIYYELEEFDALDALISSFKVFIHRKQELTQNRRENYKNIIRFIQKLLHLNTFDRKAKQELQTQIEETKVLTKKAWFLEQLAKM